MSSIGNLEELYLHIRPDRYYFLKFIIEAYDGIAILSNSQIKKEIVVIRYPRELRNVIFELLGAIAEGISPFSHNLFSHK